LHFVLSASLVSPSGAIQLRHKLLIASYQRRQSKERNLLQSALKGNKEAENRYKTLLETQTIAAVSQSHLAETQAICALYPCDIQPGALDNIMDRLVNRGYNQVYIEVFTMVKCFCLPRLTLFGLPLSGCLGRKY